MRISYCHFYFSENERLKLMRKSRKEWIRIRGQEETIQTTALLKSAWILRRVMKTWADLLLLKLQWKTFDEH